MDKTHKTGVVLDGKTYTLDRRGFLDPPEQWDESFADGMARLLGIDSGLTPEHWDIVRYLRRKLTEERTVPLVADACADNGKRLSELKALFPTGYHRGACKIAGANYRILREREAADKASAGQRRTGGYRTDALGFLEDFTTWDEAFPDSIREEMQIGKLTESHWNMIRYLRKYYERYHNVPTVFEACTVNDLSLGDLKRLFPAGYQRGACRMAGLPFIG